MVWGSVAKACHFNSRWTVWRSFRGIGGAFSTSAPSQFGTSGVDRSLSEQVPSQQDNSFHPTLLNITEIGTGGDATSKVVKKSDLLTKLKIQPRDLRFSTASSIYVRGNNIIFRLQHMKAIIKYDSLILLDSDHPAVQEFIPQLQRKFCNVNDLPFEFVAMECMLLNMFSELDAELDQLEPALKNVLNSLLDPRLFSVDRGELHVLLHHSKSLSEFHSVVRDVECTLEEILDADESMADMYLTHLATVGLTILPTDNTSGSKSQFAYLLCSDCRDSDNVEEVCNMLEAYSCQVENIQSRVQMLRELIDSSESVILINLDSQRNIMLRLGLQLEMGSFSAAIAGLIGMAFGMNLTSSLEENKYVFWVCTGLMVAICGLLWRRLLLFLGKSVAAKLPLQRTKGHKL